MSEDFPSKAEQEGLHEYGGGFQEPASGGFAFPEGWTDGDSGLVAYEIRQQQKEAAEGDMTITAYSPPSQTPPPLELEAKTSEPARTPEPAAEVEGLTIQEAASAYGISESTVRRLVAPGKGKTPKVAAAKVTGPKGVEYRISSAALEALGYKVKVTQSGAVLTAARANLEAETLAVKVRELESSLEVEKIRREAAEQRSADLTQSLSDLREVIAKLPKALEPVKTKRRWFKKS